MLYPVISSKRTVIDLSGTWKFKLEDDLCPVDTTKPLDTDRFMAVPGSYNDQGVIKEIRRHVGSVFYEKDFYVLSSLRNERLVLRFGSATHSAKVYLNGKLLVTHKGGFTPFEAEINDFLVEEKNTLLVEVSNIIDYTTLPVGNYSEVKNEDGTITRKLRENFDFFNYAGLHRPVKIYTTPKDYIKDIVITYDDKGNDSDVHIATTVVGNKAIKVILFDQAGSEIGTAYGDKVTFKVTNATLWEPLNPYHYSARVLIVDNDDNIIDEYNEDFGIRYVRVANGKFYINNKPFYFKGFGKHEDLYYNGRGLNEAANIMDLNLLKWLGANSFRTSHYPYSEEMMRLADKQGIVIIDETTAVGLMQSFSPDLISMENNKPKNIWEQLDTSEAHKQVITELIERDKNYACVVMWSIANEPASNIKGAYEYFKPLVELTKELDPQNRPVTIVNIMTADVTKDLVAELLDVICLNRYYGWYVFHQDLEAGKKAFIDELNGWQKRCPDKPIVMTEYGADTIPGLHAIDDIPYTEEYQVAYYEMNHEVFDSIENLAGEQLWNFADFETWTGIIRIQGNHKGIFTRNREPKMVARVLKERWEAIPNFNYK